jgi:hypothetical protein
MNNVRAYSLHVHVLGHGEAVGMIRLQKTRSANVEFRNRGA